MSEHEPTDDEITEADADDTEGNRVLRSQPPREGDHSDGKLG